MGGCLGFGDTCFYRNPVTLQRTLWVLFNEIWLNVNQTVILQKSEALNYIVSSNTGNINYIDKKFSSINIPMCFTSFKTTIKQLKSKNLQLFKAIVQQYQQIQRLKCKLKKEKQLNVNLEKIKRNSDNQINELKKQRQLLYAQINKHAQKKKLIWEENSKLIKEKKQFLSQIENLKFQNKKITLKNQELVNSRQQLMNLNKNLIKQKQDLVKQKVQSLLSYVKISQTMRLNYKLLLQQKQKLKLIKQQLTSQVQEQKAAHQKEIHNINQHIITLEVQIQKYKKQLSKTPADLKEPLIITQKLEQKSSKSQYSKSQDSKSQDQNQSDNKLGDKTQKPYMTNFNFDSETWKNDQKQSENQKCGNTIELTFMKKPNLTTKTWADWEAKFENRSKNQKFRVKTHKQDKKHEYCNPKNQ